MPYALESRKNDCRNCYKCIRGCPVKSISFGDNNQASIIHDDCILCGHCFLLCPQECKEIRDDISKAKALIKSGKKVILGGDYNVILTDFDVYNPEMFRNNALFREEVKQRLKAIEYLGYYDAYRCLYPTEVGYTYWDYAGSALAMDQGMRIDYLLLSAKAVDALDACYVDRQTRSGDKPSDHAPLVAVFK